MKLKTICFTQIGILLVAAPATGSPFQEEIELAIRAELEQSGVPSLQVAVGSKGEVIYEGAFGLADLDLDDDVDRDDIRVIISLRNTTVPPSDPIADFDNNGIINVIDARSCVRRCTLPRCAVQ